MTRIFLDINFEGRGGEGEEGKFNGFCYLL